MLDPNLERQRLAALEGALILSRPDLGVLEITGKDRATWLNGLVTQEVSKTAPGAGAYALAVGKTGKILAELLVAVEAERLLVATHKEGLEGLKEHFDKHLIMEDVTLSDLSETQAVLLAIGPFAAEMMNLAKANGARAGLVDFTGREGSSVIFIAQGGAGELAETLAKRGGERGAIATEEGWEQVRVEWGLPRWGVDFDETTLPQEASLEKLAVSFEKGCYLGQEAVFMLQERGHAKKHLMRLDVDGSAELAVGTDLETTEGVNVGVITSVAQKPTGGRLALGFVKHKEANVGQELRAGGRAAIVTGFAARPL